MTIREQIKALKLPQHVIDRILELTFLARAYDLDLHTSEFMLTQAFKWQQTREQGEYWLEVHKQIEYQKFLEKENEKKSN